MSKGSILSSGLYDADKRFFIGLDILNWLCGYIPLYHIF